MTLYPFKYGHPIYFSLDNTQNFRFQTRQYPVSEDVITKKYVTKLNKQHKTRCKHLFQMGDYPTLKFWKNCINIYDFASHCSYVYKHDNKLCNIMNLQTGDTVDTT